jgi:hypothetical protein
MAAGQFPVDLSRTIWQWSLMERRYAKDTHHTVSAGIMEALGKGLLIATAGLVAGLMFGTAHLPELSLWTVGVAAAGGVVCMIGSALVRNAGFDGCEREGEQSPASTEVGKGMAAVPGLEAAEVAAEECRARQRVTASRERGHGSGRCI